MIVKSSEADRYAASPPKHMVAALVFGLLQQLQALGLDIPTVMQQLAAGDGSKVAEAAKAAVEVVSKKSEARSQKSEG